MPLTIKEANILDATESYIVQQNCCTAIRAAGLSAAIASKWPACNPYVGRRRYAPRLNWAADSDRPQPGTIQVMDNRVICAFAQYQHGSVSDPSTLSYPDTKTDRLRYFQQCLEAIAALKPASLAIPYGIGCGLAGGNWAKYSAILEDFAAKNPAIQVVLYRLPA